MPCPILAGKRKTMYFHRASTNFRDVTSVLPRTMSAVPVLTSGRSLPQRDMMMPAVMAPTGVARDGMARRAPALEGESSRTTWK